MSKEVYISKEDYMSKGDYMSKEDYLGVMSIESPLGELH